MRYGAERPDDKGVSAEAARAPRVSATSVRANEWWASLQSWLEEKMGMLIGTEQPRFAGQRGQGLVEYSLIILLVVLAIIGGLVLVGPTLGNIFSSVRPVL